MEALFSIFLIILLTLYHTDFFQTLKLSLWNFRVSDELSSEQKMDIQVDSDDIEKTSKNFESNSLCYSSGNEELDSVLTDHLLYCTKLISVSI